MIGAEVLNLLGFSSERQAKDRCGIPFSTMPAFAYEPNFSSFKKDNEVWDIVSEYLQIEKKFKTICSKTAKKLQTRNNRLLFMTFFPRTYYEEKRNLVHFSCIYNEGWKDNLKEKLSSHHDDRPVRWDDKMIQWEMPVEFLPEVSDLFCKYFDFIIDINNETAYTNLEQSEGVRANIPFKRLPSQFAVSLSAADILQDLSSVPELSRYLDSIMDMSIRLKKETEVRFYKVADFNEKILYDKPFLAIMLTRHGCPITVHYSTIIRYPVSVIWHNNKDKSAHGKIVYLDSLYEDQDWPETFCTETDIRKWLCFFDIEQVCRATAEINKRLKGLVHIAPINMFYLNNTNDDRSSNTIGLGFVRVVEDSVLARYEEKIKSFLDLHDSCDLVYLNDTCPKSCVFEVLLHETTHIVIRKLEIEQKEDHDTMFYIVYAELFELLKDNDAITDEEKEQCRRVLQEAGF